MCNKSVETLGREFVNGYVAGSCVSYYDALTTFSEALADEGIVVPSPDVLEKWLDNAIESADIFLCDCCNWWCWNHEHSTISSDGCEECYPDEDYE